MAHFNKALATLSGQCNALIQNVRIFQQNCDQKLNYLGSNINELGKMMILQIQALSSENA